MSNRIIRLLRDCSRDWRLICASRVLKKEFSAIREKLWKEMFWSRSYCLLTTGGAPIEVVRRCIEGQGAR